MLSTLSIAVPVWRGRPRPRNAPSKIAPSGNCRSRFVIIFLLLATFTSFAAAQRSPRGTFASGRVAHSPRLTRPSPYESLPFPFLGDLNLDALYSSGYPVASQPPVVFLQAGGALSSHSASRSESRESSTIQPLVIELQNGRYVRIPNTEASGDSPTLEFSAQSQPPTQSRGNSQTVIATPPAHNPAPTVLVFQDGHNEEVRDYTIASGTLYARGNYYRDGYWLKPISLTTLNVPQTLQANASRGVKFVLPSAPNEVITSF